MDFKKSFLLLSFVFVSHHTYGMFGFGKDLVAKKLPKHLNNINPVAIHDLSNNSTEASKSQPTSPTSSPRKKGRRNSQPPLQEARKHIDLP
jgi:hypothetical protein